MSFKLLFTKILKTSVAGRKLYPIIRKYYWRFAWERVRRRLHTHGYEVLRRVDDVAERHNIPYFASYGTLLGFIRDGGFIAHDADIDLGVLPGTITPQKLVDILLRQESGFRFVRALEFREHITEVTFQCMKIVLDFFFYEVDGDRMFVTSYFWEPGRRYPSARENSVRRIYQAPVTHLTKMTVHGVNVSVPVNSEELIASQYGPGWRVPDPRWKNENHPGIVIQSDYGYAVGLKRVHELAGKA